MFGRRCAVSRGFIEIIGVLDMSNQTQREYKPMIGRLSHPFRPASYALAVLTDIRL